MLQCQIKKDCLHLVLTTVSSDPITSEQLRQIAVYMHLRFVMARVSVVSLTMSVCCLELLKCQKVTLYYKLCFGQNDCCLS